MAKILNLRNPSQKMSKSSPSVQSRILITDSPQEIQSKITLAVADSIKFVTYNPINKPGISNLLDIYCSITGEEESLSKRFEGRMADELKSQLVDVPIYFINFKPSRPRLPEDAGVEGVVEEFIRDVLVAVLLWLVRRRVVFQIGARDYFIDGETIQGGMLESKSTNVPLPTKPHNYFEALNPAVPKTLVHSFWVPSPKRLAQMKE
ncbi:hypothetical protein BY996DRAFT_6410409 [Phakopsora pachyrhizi]|nr:hypothetical protein BY996DRAFT_6410409 [Phakopsora pachyrhizi]